MLIEAVVVVAAEASAQMAWPDKQDVPPDEIALGSDDAFRLARRLVEDGQLSRGVLPSLQMIRSTSPLPGLRFGLWSHARWQLRVMWNE
ncbi:hypothetical protein AB0D11_39450 [Streptomyces monashensis]|uniref:hypothetical protein n=1 Tax=Streptomyces monashensis TaxID=1678012 RepID=UPI003409EAD1